VSYEEAREIAEKGYKYVASWSEFEAYSSYYCRNADNSILECVKIWRNGRTGGRGGSVFRGIAEEVYAWISWDSSGLISSAGVKEALKIALGVEIDRSKIDRAYRNVVRKVMGI
jgi:hypothetical protein